MKFIIKGKIVEKFPWVENLYSWKEYENQAYLQMHPIDILFDDDANKRVRFWPLYHQCCGMREIGNVQGDIQEELYKFVKDNFPGIGALQYTEVFCDEEMEYKYSKDGSLLCRKWPGATFGSLWYNPNSGNWVRIVTLPINQETYTEEESPDEYDEDEE